MNLEETFLSRALGCDPTPFEKPMANIQTVTVTLTQDADDAQGYDAPDQALTLTLQDTGGGPFMILETERWAFDEPKELHRLLKRVWDQTKPLFEAE